MRNDVKVGCVAFLLSLALTTSSLAQAAPSLCAVGTIGGKCLNPGIANAAQQRSRLLVFNGSRTILPLPPGQDAAIADLLLQSNKRQPQFGLDGTTGFTGGGGPNIVYGRWN